MGITGGFPASLNNLRNLSSFSLNSVQFDGFPANLSGIGNLSLLDLRLVKFGNFAGLATIRNVVKAYVIDFPFLNILTDLRGLQSLWITTSAPTQPIPSGIGSLRNLTELSLDGYFASDIPLSIYSLTQMRFLTIEIYGGNLTYLNDTISSMVNLETLYLSGSVSFKVSLPPLTAFPRLRVFYLSATGIATLPSFSGHQELQEISIYGVSLNTPFPIVGPEGTPNLRMIRFISVWCTPYFPFPIVNSPKLLSWDMISVSVNSSMTAAMFPPSLQTFQLSNMPFMSGTFPPEFALATNLSFFSVFAIQQVTGELPAPVGGFPNLSFFQLWLSGIESFSPNLADSPKLTSLYACSTQSLELHLTLSLSDR